MNFGGSLLCWPRSLSADQRWQTESVLYILRALFLGKRLYRRILKLFGAIAA